MSDAVTLTVWNLLPSHERRLPGVDTFTGWAIYPHADGLPVPPMSGGLHDNPENTLSTELEAYYLPDGDQ